MLATLTHDPFSDRDWIFERKLDGVRCLVFRRGQRVRIVSRNNQAMNQTWPELVDALRDNQCDDFIADGEIVAFDGHRTSFERLQKRIGIQSPAAARHADIAVYLYLFDLLHLAGYDTTRLPQRDRKALLKRGLSFSGRVRYLPHRNQHGEAYFSDACDQGREGLVAKHASSPYVHHRSRAWLKFKCVNRQELVIGGFTEPRGSRHGFGALLVGYYDDRGALHYAGKVGTGFDDATLESLGERLKALERERSPFSGNVKDRSAHFVRPDLVGELSFTEWTRKGRLRHPRFLGLRTDKKPRDVRRERPER